MKCFVSQSSVNVLRSRENLYEIKFGMISDLFVLVLALVDYPDNIYLSRLSPFMNIYMLTICYKRPSKTTNAIHYSYKDYATSCRAILTSR